MAKVDLKSQFDKAAASAQKLPERPDNDTLLKLYALYKQGTEGDVKGDKPGFFDFIATAKYEAWGQLKGTAQDDAQQKYVELVKKLGG
ncbi:MAG TPA: acyl-CoA-binding protein [Casimicrobiaceae bacterium]|nr:acyl-CoA-binding protein [Casimicrobiaceae bacterium]